jgi:hypothetical protein
MGKGTTAKVHPADLVFLERRGALSHRGARTFSRSAVLHRELQLLRAMLAHYDPQRTGALSAEMAALAARLLPEPWLIKPAAVEHLALRLQEAPGLAAESAAAGVEPAALIAAVAALGLGEKAALLDLALQVQAPAAALAEEDGEA